MAWNRWATLLVTSQHSQRHTHHGTQSAQSIITKQQRQKMRTPWQLRTTPSYPPSVLCFGRDVRVLLSNGTNNIRSLLFYSLLFADGSSIPPPHSSKNTLALQFSNASSMNLSMKYYLVWTQVTHWCTSQFYLWFLRRYNSVLTM